MADFEPIVIDTREELPEVEQIHLFTIDGVDYSMPAEVPPSVGLQAMEMVRTEGEMVANAWMLEEALGSDGYHALINCRHITIEQMRQIGDIVAEHMLGAFGDDGGNGQGPNRANRRAASRVTSSNGRGSGAGSSTTKRTSTRTSGGSTGSPRKQRKTA